MTLHKHLLRGTLIGVGWFAVSVYADTNDNIVEQTVPSSALSTGAAHLTLGAGLANTTLYVGSNQRRDLFVPTLQSTWGNGWFAGFPRGIGYNLSDDPRVEYGLRATADMGRKQSASAALKGLGTIGLRPELGEFLSYSLTERLKLNTSIRYGSGSDSQGALLDMGFRYLRPLDENQFLTFGIVATYANSNYMQSYFGVNAAQAATSKYAQYTPGAGIREVDLTVSHTYKFDSNWAMVTGVDLGRLGSAVTSAPMTTSNSHDSVYAQANYTF